MEKTDQENYSAAKIMGMMMLWALQIALAAFFLLAGVVKVAGAEQITRNFREWGYGDGFRIFVGILESLGGLGLLFPFFCAVSGLILMVLMGGAFYTHLAAGEGFATASPALVLALLLAVLVYFRRGPLMPPARGPVKRVVDILSRLAAKVRGGGT